MNILFISSLYPVSPDLHAPGTTLALHHFVKYWNRWGKVVVVCPVYIYLKEILTGKSNTLFKKSLKKKIFFLDGVQVIVYPIFKIPKLAYFFYPLYRFLDRFLNSIDFKPDMVVGHYDKSLHIAYRYARKRRTPFTAGLHITPDLMEDDPRAFTRRCGEIIEHAALAACRSNYIRDKVARWFPQHSSKCFTAFSGIDPVYVEDVNRGLIRLEEWKSQAACPVSILSVGALIRRKSIDKNLKALARLEGRIDWRYTVIGGGPERWRLEKMAWELGIAERVCFKGKLPHHRVMEEMNRSHIFLLVSYMETFGLVYLEALAAGNIVIAAVKEGIDGIVQHGKNGFLIPSSDIEAMKEVLESVILQMPVGDLEGVLREAHQTAAHYSEENMAQLYWESMRDVPKNPIGAGERIFKTR